MFQCPKSKRKIGFRDSSLATTTGARKALAGRTHVAKPKSAAKDLDRALPRSKTADPETLAHIHPARAFLKRIQRLRGHHEIQFFFFGKGSMRFNIASLERVV